MLCKECGYNNSDQARYCAKCGKALDTNHEKPVKGIVNKGGLVLCVAVFVVLLAFLLYAFADSNGYEVCTHVWQEGTCTQPQKCKMCGFENGVAKGHQWISATCISPRSCSGCGIVEGTAIGHQWTDATCTSPKICSKCKKTEGSATNHKWIAASCMLPNTCSMCGKTEGSPKGHDWKDATFVESKTCRRCNATEGTALDWRSISVGAEVKDIRKEYQRLVAEKDAGKYRKETPRKGVEVYYDGNNQIACALIYAGTPGLGDYGDDYNRTYYFRDGKLMFTFLNGDDQHRFYFYDGLLMRWRYSPVGLNEEDIVDYDFTFSPEYMSWEERVLEEARSLG